MKLVTKYIALLFMFGQLSLNAQSDMVTMRPIDFSPGMVGNKGTSISVAAQNMNFNSAFKTFNSSLTFEFLSEKLKGGIGISYSSSLSDLNGLISNTSKLNKTSSQRLNFVYAPKFVIQRKLQISPFVKLSAMHINTGSFFNTMDTDIQRMQIPWETKTNVLSSSLGVLVNKPKWFVGIEAYGLNSSKHDSIPFSKKMGLQFQAGKFFKFTKDHKYGMSLILAHDFYNFSEKLNHMSNSILLNFKLNKLSVLLSHHRNQLWHTNYRSLRVGLGYQPTEKIKIGYSVNVDRNNFTFNKWDHQIGFQYIIKKKNEGFF